MNTVLQTIIASGSAHGTPMQRAIFGYLPNATNFYLDTITIEGKGQYIYTLGGKKVVADLEDDFSGSIWVPAADAGSKLIVRGEAITGISQDDQQSLTSLDVSGLTELTYLDCSNNSLIKSVSFNATKQSPSTAIANLITAADSTTGEVYLNSSDVYYSTVANAATAKGWTIKPL